MFYTPNLLVRFCAAIAVIASLAVSVTHAGSLARAAYRVRVLPLEFPFVAGFNDRQQVIGYAPQNLTSVGFLWDAKQGLRLIDPSASAIPFDINKHGEVVGLRRGGPGFTLAFFVTVQGPSSTLGPSLPMVSMIADRQQDPACCPVLKVERLSGPRGWGRRISER